MRPPVWPSVFTNIKTPLKNRVGNKFRKLQPINPVGRRSLVEFGCMERYSFILLKYFNLRSNPLSVIPVRKSL